MLIEQAFFHLPEILHGSGYNRQEYEAGIVGALSLAILQVLNGRNATNPIKYLQMERLYRRKGEFSGSTSRRYLRADLYCNCYDLRVGNNSISRYGWRHNIWLEAKFFRGQTKNGTKGSSNKSAHVAGVIADLLRLSTLVEEQSSYSSNGRYFLHVYDSDPSLYLTLDKRSWMGELCQPGQQKVEINNLELEVKSVKGLLGEFPGLELNLEMTNHVIKPLASSGSSCYWMYLSRLDAIVVKLGNHESEMGLDRAISVSTPNALDEIARFVSQSIHIRPSSIEAQSSIDEDEDEDDGRVDLTEAAESQASVLDVVDAAEQAL